MCLTDSARRIGDQRCGCRASILPSLTGFPLNDALGSALAVTQCDEQRVGLLGRGSDFIACAGPGFMSDPRRLHGAGVDLEEATRSIAVVTDNP
jgi:hypothetical protein